MTAPSSALVENFFRHEYGRLVASLSRQMGMQHLEAVEDAVQTALMAALQTWTVRGLPDSPSAWLYRVARNEVLTQRRRYARRDRILSTHQTTLETSSSFPPDPTLPNEVSDDLLRMLFVCCHASIPIESQIVLALKTLCGFSVREVALRLFTSEANVYKRLERARRQLQKHRSAFDDIGPEQYRARRSAVHRVVYFMFTEGHLASSGTMAMRQELCHEAIRLGTLVAEQAGDAPETAALLALMHMHAGRMSARVDASGGLLLLEEQDRTKWNFDQIQTGFAWLARSASGEVYSRYHAEAAIAAEHCMATSFEKTRWDKIVEGYDRLEHIAPSALHRLNRAMALAEWRGPSAGLEALETFEPPAWLTRSYLWSAAMADLNQRMGRQNEATHYRRSALSRAPSSAVRRLLERRLSGREQVEAIGDT